MSEEEGAPAVVEGAGVGDGGARRDEGPTLAHQRREREERGRGDAGRREIDADQALVDAVAARAGRGGRGDQFVVGLEIPLGRALLGGGREVRIARRARRLAVLVRPGRVEVGRVGGEGADHGIVGVDRGGVAVAHEAARLDRVPGVAAGAAHDARRLDAAAAERGGSAEGEVPEPPVGGARLGLDPGEAGLGVDARARRRLRFRGAGAALGAGARTGFSTRVAGAAGISTACVTTVIGGDPAACPPPCSEHPTARSSAAARLHRRKGFERRAAGIHVQLPGLRV